MKRVHRSQLKNAPYNPRSIDAYAREKLRKLLGMHGLVETLVWNSATGNLVGGHQRLAALDVLEGHGNYLIDVAVVQKTEAEEIELNIVLNNPGIGGTWDLVAMKELLKREDVNLEHTGFDPVDLQVMGFDDADLRVGEVDTAMEDATVTELQQMTQNANAANAAEKSEPKKMAERDIAKIIAGRQEKREQYQQEGATETYCVVMFPSDAHRMAFLAALNLGYEERYIEGRRMCAALSISEEDVAKIAEAAKAEASEENP